LDIIELAMRCVGSIMFLILLEINLWSFVENWRVLFIFWI